MKAGTFNMNINDIGNYENIKDKLFVHALNYEINARELRNAVYQKIAGDVAIVLYACISSSTENLLSFKIPKSQFIKWGKSFDEIYSEAFDNTLEMFPPRFFKLNKMIFDPSYSGEPFMDQDYNLSLNLYGDILSNEKKINGATSIFIPEVTEKIGQMVGGDFYFIFTSVHECIIHSTSCDRHAILNSAIDTVNECINNGSLQHNEVLSYHAYRYNSKEKKIEIAL